MSLHRAEILKTSLFYSPGTQEFSSPQAVACPGVIMEARNTEIINVDLPEGMFSVLLSLSR